MSTDFNGLDDSPIFTDFSSTELAALSQFFTSKEIGEGKAVFVENMPGECLYLIKQGTIRISKMMAEGDEETLVVLGPADVFGEMALFDDALRSATARVTENSILLVFSKKDFDNLRIKDPKLCLKLALNIIRLFSRRIRTSQASYRGLLLEALGRNR
jgi:CRP-like cAMP-binding protein